MRKVFMMVQRWRISSNSQHVRCARRSPWRCLWWFKDEEFQAIHNTWAWTSSASWGVYDGSKMKNFKQFTTCSLYPLHISMVFMMVQRWRISSNSQLHQFLQGKWDWCLWWFKDEEFQAIHNYRVKVTCDQWGVYDGSKMKNFKQFTTTRAWLAGSQQVFMMVQRWRISSNSQPRQGRKAGWTWCLWWFKDEEFQAIHNSKQASTGIRIGVYDGSKMKNFKQFTTLPQFRRKCCAVFMMVQRWRISSNSQL